MPLFELKDVAEQTGVPPRRIANWCDKGYIIPEQNAEGKGKHRKFNEINLMEAKILNVLVSTYSPGIVTQVMNMWRELIDNYVDLRELLQLYNSKDSPYSELHLYIDEKNICLVGGITPWDERLREKDVIWCSSLEKKKPEGKERVPKPERTQFVLNLRSL